MDEWTLEWITQGEAEEKVENVPVGAMALQNCDACSALGFFGFVGFLVGAFLNRKVARNGFK